MCIPSAIKEASTEVENDVRLKHQLNEHDHLLACPLLNVMAMLLL